MEFHLFNLLRRSRQPHQRAAAHELNNSLEKRQRMTPDQLKEIQDANSRAAAAGASVSLHYLGGI
jgi:hypothetical protein